MKNQKTHCYTSKLILILFIVVVCSIQSGYSQIPESMVREVDKFTNDMLNAFYILRDKTEDNAVKELGELKPVLIERANSLLSKLENLPDPTEIQEEAYVNKQMEKQVYKDFMTLLSNREFLNRINGSPVLLKEYNELMAIMDSGLGSDDEEADIQYEENVVCTFNVGAGVPYSGDYSVTASDDGASAYMGDLFFVEINGSSKDNEISILLFIEKPVPGKYQVENELQVIIQGITADGDSFMELSSIIDGGVIQFDKIEKAGGKVSGSFSGKFTDDTNNTDKPVTVQGKFNAVRVDN